ncbi:hypothetical protein GCM10008957_52380 [Deinococcus ruber]|uniref:Uncharacterized protein n=1 Tax=Deinococcus ruber TaxID=1848197 RepID=A0A918FGE3_9DEIO|nr:hypothetical protein GCM10008957_52380 [Deinococcus ruber]
MYDRERVVPHHISSGRIAANKPGDRTDAQTVSHIDTTQKQERSEQGAHGGLDTPPNTKSDKTADEGRQQWTAAPGKQKNHQTGYP